MFFFRFIARRQQQHQKQSCRTFVDARIKWVRDRGLDHVVEKEKNLRPMLALKNLIKSEPSKSLPVSIAAEHKSQLALPTRAIEFIRKYPSIFQEFLPSGGSPARPHVRLTPEVLRIDDEEQTIYESDTHRQNAADRLLRLLMLSRVNKLPLQIVDRLRWDLGLPPDYVRTLLTDYPDYFDVTSMKNSNSSDPILALDLVCWSDELAVSVMEKKAKNGDNPYKKGMPLAFPLQFSRGFEVEKKVKKWVDEWQKLPYISPYENALHLQSNSDQAEKWTVAVLHELLHLFISKKTEKENIICLGDHLGLRSRFKRALLNHPGIFYVSNKIRTHTVVLREAYKRDLLLEKHPLMGMRYQYIHLMNKGKELVKPTGDLGTAAEQQRITHAATGEEQDEELDTNYGSESEDASDDEEVDEDDDDDDDEEDDDEDELDGRQSAVVGRGRTTRNAHSRIETRRPLRSSGRGSSNGRYPNMVGDKVPTLPSRRVDSHKTNNGVRAPGRSNYPRSRGRLSTEKRSTAAS